MTTACRPALENPKESGREYRRASIPNLEVSDKECYVKNAMSTAHWVVRRAGHLPSIWGNRLLNDLAVGGIEGQLF